MLITGYDGDEPVFVVNLACDADTDEASQRTTEAFEAIYRIVDRLAKVSVDAVSQGSNL